MSKAEYNSRKYVNCETILRNIVQMHVVALPGSAYCMPSHGVRCKPSGISAIHAPTEVKAFSKDYLHSSYAQRSNSLCLRLLSPAFRHAIGTGTTGRCPSPCDPVASGAMKSGVPFTLAWLGTQLDKPGFEVRVVKCVRRKLLLEAQTA